MPDTEFTPPASPVPKGLASNRCVALESKPASYRVYRFAEPPICRLLLWMVSHIEHNNDKCSRFAEALLLAALRYQIARAAHDLIATPL